ncbi:50S ribosomal protein L25/general stress protein Ctc [Acinetobacter sp. WZC-1]|uniref:50S ribosomal protein L25/general stress protein Ctc n=1 Tax=Acinetobacter sp. WZC-1 TaxID=3459034 RepID=UPI00403D84FE
MSNFSLNAQVRADDKQGKGASRRLRREALVPAIIYGADKEPASITLELRELIKALEDNSFFSSIITLNVDGKEEQAVIKALQRHPAKNTPMHADFLRVKKGEVIAVNVPVNILNQETSVGVKAGGIASVNLTEIHVETLPRDLPSAIDVDIAQLDIGQVIHLSDLKLPKGVTIPALAQEGHDQAVVSIVVVHEEKEEATDAETEEDKDE